MIFTWNCVTWPNGCRVAGTLVAGRQCWVGRDVLFGANPAHQRRARVWVGLEGSRHQLTAEFGLIDDTPVWALEWWLRTQGMPTDLVTPFIQEGLTEAAK